jgi:hypothetical protein
VANEQLFGKADTVELRFRLEPSVSWIEAVEFMYPVCLFVDGEEVREGYFVLCVLYSQLMNSRLEAQPVRYEDEDCVLAWQG